MICALATVSFLTDSATLWSAPPTLSHLFPAGGQRGTKVVVTCTGTFSWPMKVWAPGLDVVVAKASGKLEVDIPKDLAADRVWIRLYNAEGASAAVPFLIDNLKEINEQEPNDSPRTAQVLADANVIVNGVLAKTADVDCFSVRLTAGKTMVAIVDANTRLGSPMDAILQVTTPDGQVLEENNDDVHLDPRLAFTPTKSGDYVVRIFAFSSTANTSIQLSGGANFIYRLTLTTGPFVTHTVPLAAPHTNPGAAEVFGWNIPPGTKIGIIPFGGSKLAEHQECEALTDVRLPSESRLGFALAPDFAGSARVRLTSHAVVSAIGPTDPKKPMALSLPTSVTGWLRIPRQIDTFRVPLKKGQQVIVSVESNSLNFPFDPEALLTDPSGAVVAKAADIGPNREAVITHAAAKDGDYLVAIRNRFRQRGELFFYRLTVRLEEPDFEMSVATDAIVVTPDKPTELPIKIQRRGPVGAIIIQAVGLPPGVTALPIVSEPAGASAAAVTLKLTTTGPAFSGPLRIAGKASQPKAIEQFVRTAPRLGAVFESIWLTVVENMAPKQAREASAPDSPHWAFQKPIKGRPPEVKNAGRVHTAIDAFLLAKLESKGLTLSPDADKVTLLRRAYLDLIGLPATPKEADEFLKDSRPDAYERLIDRLLASPHYGERWGRHWLDAAGYVDNRLFDGDLAMIYPNEGIWRYRDYVIRSFNEDKPWNRFITEQLAGDELTDWRSADKLTDQMRELLTATGYMRLVEDHTSEPQYGIDKRYDVVFNLMEMTSTSLMGLTMECSRCHDHKYDPISQRDYYQLMACFEPAYNVHAWRKPQERFLADVSLKEKAAIDEHNAEVERRIGELQKGNEKSADLPKRVAELAASKRSYGKIQALWDVGLPPISRLLRRGNVNRPAGELPPAFITAVSLPGKTEVVKPAQTQGTSSGRRLALAQWLTSPEHPLTARVIVNRVWHHHFGRGIVATLGNFGRSGSTPSHPELLDWLAVDFVENGWSLKRLHRQVMTSTAYRQSSRRPSTLGAVAERKDPENHLLWRMNLRRLEAEIVRDSVLAVSGKIDRAPGGPPIAITNPADGVSEVKREPTPTSSYRRSLYLFARRVYPLKFLEVFDSPIMPVNCTQRTNSATVLQALTFLNSAFVIEQAEHVAARVRAQAGETVARQVEVAHQIVLARPPSAREQEKCQTFLRDQKATYAQNGRAPDRAERDALADLCHMLLCTNEFLYVE